MISLWCATSSHRYGHHPCGVKHLAKSMTLRQSGKSSLMSWPDVILLPAGTSIVLPVGYMNQPTGLSTYTSRGGYVEGRGGYVEGRGGGLFR